jgi:hypothetical protein
MLEELSQELARLAAQTAEFDDIMGAFPLVLQAISPAQSRWSQLSEEGMEFDLDRALAHSDELQFTHAAQGKIPALRILRYYLGAFVLAEQDRLELWHEILTWDDQKQLAFASVFQILSRFMTLENQAKELRPLFQALVILCRPAGQDHSCDVARVIEHTLCILKAKLEDFKTEVDHEVQSLAWPLSTTAFLQIIVRLTLCILRYAPDKACGLRLSFKKEQTAESIGLSLSCEGLVISRDQQHLIVAAMSTDLVEAEDIQSLLHARHLAEKYGTHIEATSTGESLCFTLRFHYAERQQQTLLKVS